MKVTDDGVRRAMERMRLGMPLGGSMLPAMQQIARAMVTGAQMRFRMQTAPNGQPWSKSYRARTEGGQTLSMSRRLRNSINGQATGHSATVGTNVVYAAIHQFGGVIRAKAGPFLAIPVTPAARAAGSPRSMEGLHVAQTLKGQFILVDSKGQTHFLLRRQVKIPARPFLGVSGSDAAEIIRIGEQHLMKRWKG
ncbi:phage virion morphogenesis protein [Aquabacterium sp. OR-4]|uniref:phage virion morphogenesis protein n=1 Tax=Aquabacterium sp. OR-4 TaxID=2978127 RepID=UPI0021B46D7C|nr:phage virion morphogenesis protein [Aquabacterium sp. OR-4]MDT7838206.1 phage virion morphogenesis protein [Aquabacterium sp. OR-4]